MTEQSLNENYSYRNRIHGWYEWCKNKAFDHGEGQAAHDVGFTECEQQRACNGYRDAVR